MEFFIDEMREEDWPRVAGIYAEGIATGHATFETEVPSWERWTETHMAGARLVARASGGEVLGWAALGQVSARAVYRGVAEVSVYVGAEARGRGVGRALLEGLIGASEGLGVWTLQAGVFPENESSVALHRSCGFRVVGRRERIGRLAGVWRDTLLLERRSRAAGAD